ncbi:Spy/CpxP family protein refolding chaperone [Methylophilus sp. Q8]|uniref:Spy/CpxP family protein refolding chaperone n=1 Tax=Methylophilus sp. Q8 TaxID=1506586 RepID=UPI000646F9EE|nr:Spy/CpxP family protein refolding chaperone [Methylophilus sp. Q8]
MKLKKLAFAGLLVLVCGTAFAEPGHGCDKGKFDKTNWQEHRLEHFEKHQEKLHTILQLTSVQENAWKNYQAQIKPQDKSEHPDVAELSKLNTLQRLDKMEAWDKERDTRQAERAKAVRTFYAQLNDAQKKAFDENAFPQHEGPHHGGPRHEK